MSKRTIIEIVVLVVLMGLLVMSMVTVREQKESNEHVTEYLQNQKDSLEKVILSLEQECEVHEQQVGVLEAKINKEQERYEKLFERYEKEIHNVSHYGHSELERFFSDRYN